MRWLTMGLAMVAAAAPAAERNIAIAGGDAWRHAETGLVLAPQLAAMTRTVLTDATLA